MESCRLRDSRADSQDGQNHTDSMITVPLSDVLSPSEQGTFDRTSIEVIGRADFEHSALPESAETTEQPTSTAPKSNGLDSEAENGLNGGQNPTILLRSSADSNGVGVLAESENDWAELDKTEEQEHRGEDSDETTALLLARLEQENNALATDPKSGLSRTCRIQRQSRSKSLHHIKKLIEDPLRSSIRYSQLPTPPMTELDFWAALVADYRQTAQRLPTLTSNKIRAGVPPPLRGVVWPSLTGARDAQLMADFQRLCGESSPYEGLIGKDIGRSFPNVEMFRDPCGEGQQMLARVLKTFSLYDAKIGYCQGLGFVVGPLLMHMSDAEAFCVLVRLMDQYELRSCYLPDLSGLHLRIYQFQNLLARHCPSLFAHLECLNVEPVYVSQWFLSFFAVTCPMPMLLRIYDVIFLEGACETLMRVALSLMQRNEKKILGCAEFEDVMRLLLSRSLWDTYALNADDLVNDFVSLTSLVTKESLQSLEESYNQSQGVSTGISFPQMQAAASRFLGRLWVVNSTKSITLEPALPRPASTLRRSASKQSMTSTLNSIESTSSDASTAPTELSTPHDLQKPRTKSSMANNRDLHSQIEDLLMALNDLQRQHADLTRDLQKEREEREEDQEVARLMLDYIHETQTVSIPATEILTRAEERFSTTECKRISIIQTKHQLRDDVQRWKDLHELEASRCLDLSRRLDEREQENISLREQLREARARIQDSYRERQRLERTVKELRAIKMSASKSAPDASNSLSTEAAASSAADIGRNYSPNGLRELRLVRTNSQNSATHTPSGNAQLQFGKRSSSLGLHSLLATENHKPPAEEALLVELVNAKTAEAVAKQELEEVKAKLEALRKLVTGTSDLSRGQIAHSRTSTQLSSPHHNIPKSASVNAAGGGFFFAGWGRRGVSTSTGNEG